MQRTTKESAIVSIPRKYRSIHPDQDRREYCKKPYMASLLNISAMSFGALSDRAVLALNTGARKGGFYHNTGEGGLSDHHLKPGGDLVWQIGTGYFGCRTAAGDFDPELFRTTVADHHQVRMIELKSPKRLTAAFSRP